MVNVLLPVADGTEEMEAIITADVLRRAKWKVTIATINKEMVLMSREVRIIADAGMSEVIDRDYDLIVLPGGAYGVENFLKNNTLLNIINKAAMQNWWIAAICAAPLVLNKLKLLEGKKFTCHPSVKDKLAPLVPSEERVVIDGKLITAQGPGISFEFALKIIEAIEGKARAEAMRKELLLQ